MNNPYSLVFGKMPANFIERNGETDEIIETFLESEPSIRTYIMTGMRGAGKTVCLSKIEKELGKEKNVIVLSLNSDIPLLDSAYEDLYYTVNKNNLLKDIDISLSAFGADVKVKKKAESTNLAMQKLLENLTKHGKKVVFCIDEISNTNNIKSFCQAYNIWLRKDYNVLMLMTGLKKNIMSLQGDDRVSFLKRAEKIEVASLSIREIANNYQKVFNLSKDDAIEMASFTKGYSYAFQVVGYLCYKNKCTYKDIINEFDIKMADNVYDIIWEDLTAKEKEVLKLIVYSELTAESILAKNQVSANTYNEYRRFLINRGIIKDCGYGKIDFTLPRFREISKMQLENGLWA